MAARMTSACDRPSCCANRARRPADSSSRYTLVFRTQPIVGRHVGRVKSVRRDPRGRRACKAFAAWPEDVSYANAPGWIRTNDLRSGRAVITSSPPSAAATNSLSLFVVSCVSTCSRDGAPAPAGQPVHRVPGLHDPGARPAPLRHTLPTFYRRAERVEVRMLTEFVGRKNSRFPGLLAPPVGFEPTTCGLEDP